MSNIKITADEAMMEEIRDFYEAPSFPNKKNPYLVFQAVTEDNIQVNAYKSKDLYTIVFTGDRDKIINEATIFVEDPQIEDDTAAENREYKDASYQIGTDEVGVGDLFGPLVVAAVYLTPDDIPLLLKLGIKDSKKMNDSRILEIGPAIQSHFIHTVCLCSPAKISSLKNSGWSMHKIMANLHNTAQNNLIKKNAVNSGSIIYVDEFASRDLYFKYLVTPYPKNFNMHFETKGETYYPAVAAASVLARFHFLKIWEEMEAKYGMIIPKGAGVAVDKCLHLLLKKHRKDEVELDVKTFFRNYQDILKE